MGECRLCPRMCGVNRNITAGFCGESESIRLARAGLHMWEEPPISGKNGSGTVFFTGCQLKCVFCQNYEISQLGTGKKVSVARLADIFLELEQKGAHNINLVSGSHFAPQIVQALQIVQNRLNIPVALNSGGYESLETLKMLEGFIDIYIPDMKYKNPLISQKYSSCADYFDKASIAVAEMQRQTGVPVLKDGIMQSGVIIRHMVLPGQWRDSLEILDWIHANMPKNGYFLSLMSQYTPCFKSDQYKEINRRVTTYEYSKVVDRAIKNKMKGFMQERSSAKGEYTPNFDFEGI